MRLLLDTHTFIWWFSDSKRLSSNSYESIADPENDLVLSLISIWEIQIKSQLAKLTLNAPLPEVIDRQRQINKLQLLSLELNHIYTLNQLAHHHRDPFDRLLIAQSIAEQLVLVSKDAVLDRYNIQRVW